MLVREYIEEMLQSCQRALDDINKNDEDITIQDILKCFGDLDCVGDRLQASKILLRIELKERKEKLENDTKIEESN